MSCRPALAEFAYYGLLQPAYTLERVAFGVKIHNPVLHELLPRIVALVAPFFWAYQVVVYATGTIFAALADLEELCELSLDTTVDSVVNCFSSILEIPEKLIFGAHEVPNYLGYQEWRYRYPKINYGKNFISSRVP